MPIYQHIFVCILTTIIRFSVSNTKIPCTFSIECCSFGSWHEHSCECIARDVFLQSLMTVPSARGCGQIFIHSCFCITAICPQCILNVLSCLFVMIIDSSTLPASNLGHRSQIHTFSSSFSLIVYEDRGHHTCNLHTKIDCLCLDIMLNHSKMLLKCASIPLGLGLTLFPL